MLARWASLIATGSLAKIEASPTIDGGYRRREPAIGVYAVASRRQRGANIRTTEHRCRADVHAGGTQRDADVSSSHHRTKGYMYIHGEHRISDHLCVRVFEALAETPSSLPYGATAARVRVRGK